MCIRDRTKCRRPRLSECERVQPEATLDAHILLPVHHIGHGSGGDRWAKVGLPQQLAVASIERNELAVTSAGEQHVRPRRQHSTLSRGRSQPERPLAFAGTGIHRDDGTENVFSSSSASRTTSHKTAVAELGGRVALAVPGGTVLPRGNVKQTRNRTKRWRIPVGAALITRE